MGTGEPSQSRLTPCQIPPFVAARHLFLSLSPAVTFLPGAGRICPGRGKSSSEREPLACLQALRFSRKLYRHVKGPLSEGAGIERSEMTGGVLASSPSPSRLTPCHLSQSERPWQSTFVLFYGKSASLCKESLSDETFVSANFTVQSGTFPPCQGLSLWESCHRR